MNDDDLDKLECERFRRDVSLRTLRYTWPLICIAVILIVLAGLK